MALVAANDQRPVPRHRLSMHRSWKVIDGADNTAHAVNTRDMTVLMYMCFLLSFATTVSLHAASGDVARDGRGGGE